MRSVAALLLPAWIFQAFDHPMSFLLRPLAVLSASALSLLGIMSTKSQKARYFFNLTLYLSALGFCSFLGVLYGIFGTILGQVRPACP